jgi:gamma-glutamylcyclotransferase (GGCT)/AIG2-like uncharacterized protein YtfP
MMPEVNAVTAPSKLARHVFVYGTLRKGDANDINCLAPKPQFIGLARVNGRMFHLGAYPGVLLGAQSQVLGEVYLIEPELERVLDEIEELYPQQKDEYVKRQVLVTLDVGQLECLVYEINPAYVLNKPLIASGDWVKDR